MGKRSLLGPDAGFRTEVIHGEQATYVRLGHAAVFAHETGALTHLLPKLVGYSHEVCVAVRWAS